MKLSSVAIILLTRAFAAEVTQALNVTVTPGPVTMCLEGDNVTVSCLVSQKKRSTSVLVLRWLYFPTPDDEHLVVKMNFKKAKYYGNYSKSFPQNKFHLLEEVEGEIYSLHIFNVSREDTGNYICRVQEIHKYRNKWRSSSNGTASMELRVHYKGVSESTDNIWLWFQDLYLCAVLICSLGLLSMLLFTVIIACQHIQRKQRLKASYYLVKCPDSSSGETVTSVASSSPGMHRKVKRHKSPSKDVTARPPEIPVKAPVPNKPRRTKLLKVQPRKTHMPRVVNDSLTYAELELVKQLPEVTRRSSSSSGMAQLDSTAQCTGTVYAQILFVEKQV